MNHLKQQLAAMQSAAHADPLTWFRPTKSQLAFIQDPAPVKLFRGANQSGKTTAGIICLLSRLLGRHEHLATKKPPIIAWAITHSWEQSKAIQQKIHDLTPKAALHPDTEFQTGKGYRGTGAPIVRYANGSILRIKTTNQSATGGSRGTLALASETVDFIWVDECPPKHLIGEIFGRVVRTRGTIAITMTPVLPVEFLRKMVEDGKCSETVAPLNLENVTPIGCRPLMTQDEIDRIGDQYLSYDKSIRLLGAWHTVPEGRIFEHFTDEMISSLPCSANGEYRFAIGIDHGSDTNSEVIILGALDISSDMLYILDEYVSGGDTAEAHARGLLAMLQRNSLSLTQIHSIVGDRSHGGNKFGGKMSNRMLQAAISHVQGRAFGESAIQIKTAYKRRFSVYWGCQNLNQYMLRKKFQIFPRCKRTIRSLKNWQLTKSGGLDSNSEWKHCIDAVRYMLLPLVDNHYRIPRIAKIRMN